MSVSRSATRSSGSNSTSSCGTTPIPSIRAPRWKRPLFEAPRRTGRTARGQLDRRLARRHARGVALADHVGAAVLLEPAARRLTGAAHRRVDDHDDRTGVGVGPAGRVALDEVERLALRHEASHERVVVEGAAAVAAEVEDQARCVGERGEGRVHLLGQRRRTAPHVDVAEPGLGAPVVEVALAGQAAGGKRDRSGRSWRGRTPRCAASSCPRPS